MLRFPSRRTLLITLLVVSSLGLAVYSVNLVQLDREIRAQFAGARWALPAQVYASPFELYPGLKIGADDFAAELERLGYRKVEIPSHAGTYAVEGSTLELTTRAFRFWDGPQDSLRLKVSFSRDAISELADTAAGRPLTLARLDPLLVGSIHPAQGEDRLLVKLDDAPPLLSAGLILVEDRRFNSHLGIDPRAILRAAWANLKAGRVVQGGSTITQQLVKNFFLNNRQTWGRKINEASMALLLEAHYSKAEILEAYMNEIWLGQDGDRAVHGFGLASHFYFNKPLAELQPHEIALLVAMAKSASYYNPRRHGDRTRARRDMVLNMFAEAGYLTKEDLALALVQPLGIAGRSGGGAERYPAFVELVRRQLRGQYAEADLTSEGLRIFTTLEPRTQEALERRLVEDLPALEESKKLDAGTLEGAGVVTRSEGGEVLALVGGRNPRYQGFNRALDSRRPIGSLAKPFVYLAALERPEQFSLYTAVTDEPVSVRLPHGAVWEPKNYDKELHGAMPFYVALANSYNLPTVRVGLDIGVERVAEAMRSAGHQEPLPPLPSLMLGAAGMSPLEVAQMYSTLASGGYLSPLSAIREVTTQSGEPLSRHPLRVREALPASSVYLLNWALEQVMIFGTGKSAYAYVSPSVRLAGKTGTTDDYRDSWFAGFGGERVAVIWVGRDDNQPTGFSGASGALPIWARLMRDVGERGFDPLPPGDVVEVMTDPASGGRADESCLNAVSIPYIVGHEPAEWAPCADAHRPDVLDWFRDIFR